MADKKKHSTKTKAESAKAAPAKKAAPEPLPVVVVPPPELPLPVPVVEVVPAPRPEPEPVFKIDPSLSQKQRDEKATLLEKEAAALRRPAPVEFPKHVVHDGVTREFKSRAEQDAAGPDWADKKK
jgi:hypothetical protein